MEFRTVSTSSETAQLRKICSVIVWWVEADVMVLPDLFGEILFGQRTSSWLLSYRYRMTRDLSTWKKITSSGRSFTWFTKSKVWHQLVEGLCLQMARFGISWSWADVPLGDETLEMNDKKSSGAQCLAHLSTSSVAMCQNTHRSENFHQSNWSFWVDPTLKGYQEIFLKVKTAGGILITRFIE